MAYPGNDGDKLLERFDEKHMFSRYSPSVLIDNWHDQICLSEDKMKIFLKKKQRGELILQKTRRMFANLLREVQLALPNEFVTFGSVVQLIAPDMPGFEPRSCGEMGVALSGVIGEKEVDCIEHFVDGCLVSCSPCLVPCVRNTFIITSADRCNRQGELLKFGQTFMLCPVETVTSTPLYVRSETPTFNTPVGVAGHGLVRLSARRDTYCRWRALYWDPTFRPETMGAPFPPHSRFVMNHVASNQNLAVEYQSWFPTFFGSECQASVHAYKNIHRRETAENFWLVNIQKPKSFLNNDKKCD